jgi:hypothetical protein
VSRFGDRRLAASQRAALLEGLVERTRAHRGRPALLVFDLDATLLDNRPRHVAILHELAERWRPVHPVEAAQLSALTAEGVAYEVTHTLQGLALTDPALHAEAEAFWAERYFTDPYLQHDEAMPGAVAFVRRAYEAGATLVYLTGRNLGAMALGTFASLRDLGFPIGLLGCELVIKPDVAVSDVAFKRQVATELGRLGDVLACFDNEPENCHGLLDAHPTSTSVLLDTLQAPGDLEPRDEVRVIDSFLI